MLVTPRPVVVCPSIPEEIPALLCCWSRRHREAPALESALRALLAFLLSNQQAQWESDRQVLCEREGFEVNTSRSALPTPHPQRPLPAPLALPSAPGRFCPSCEASALEQRQPSEAGRAHRWVAVPMSQAQWQGGGDHEGDVVFPKAPDLEHHRPGPTEPGLPRRHGRGYGGSWAPPDHGQVTLLAGPVTSSEGEGSPRTLHQHPSSRDGVLASVFRHPRGHPIDPSPLQSATNIPSTHKPK